MSQIGNMSPACPIMVRLSRHLMYAIHAYHIMHLMVS